MLLIERIVRGEMEERRVENIEELVVMLSMEDMQEKETGKLVEAIVNMWRKEEKKKVVFIREKDPLLVSILI